MKTIKCVVAGVNSNGEADFCFVKVRCTDEEYDLGIAFDFAESFAFDMGYEGPFVTFDGNDPPMRGRGFIDLFEWDTASTVRFVEQDDGNDKIEEVK